MPGLYTDVSQRAWRQSLIYREEIRKTISNYSKESAVERMAKFTGYVAGLIYIALLN